MKSEVKQSLKSFLVELLVYAVMVVGYYFLVLHLLGKWLFHLFHDERRTYAAVALLLIVSQGIVLETLTTALLSLIKSHREEE